MDPHSLAPCLMEGGMQLECLPAGEHIGSRASFEQTVVSVQGRLRKCSKFWTNELEASQFVCDIVTSGYRLPFLAFPPAVCAKNNKSAIEHATFVSKAIQELLEAGCVTRVSSCPTVCSPLQVVVSAKGKKRLVIDLRYVNQYLHITKFKYEGLNLIPVLFKKGDYMFTFDLKSGYHHVDIHEDSQKYLGFSWDEGMHREFFIFRVLPFGLASACYVFTKLLRPLVKRWRARGLRVILYIDDGICASSSVAKCIEDKNVILSDLERAGFVLNVSKSCLEPHQIADWLGFTVDLGTGCFRVPQDKISRLKYALQTIRGNVVNARSLASVIGQIISMSLALGSVTRLQTRAMYAVLSQRIFWSDRLSLSSEAADELAFWQQNIDRYNSQSIWFSAGATRIVYSDASSTGYGGYVVELGPEFSQGQWSVDEIALSSTWRELKAVYNVLQSFSSKLRGHAVKWFSDNQAVVHIVQVGSRKPHLQDGALSIFELCFRHGIKLEIEWIPRQANEIADYVSRIRDFDDRMLNPSLFQFLDSNLGPHTVDCFASEQNRQILRFHSRYWSPGAEAVDTFTVNWSDEICWLLPPVYLIGRALSHGRACHAQGTLLVPLWKSAPFWPLLCPDGRHFASFIHAYYIFPYEEGMLLPGCSGHNIGDSFASDSSLLAIYFDFTRPPRLFNEGFCV